MNSTFNDVILQKDIKLLGLSRNFMNMAAANGFVTLEEILSFRLSILIRKDGFTPEVLQEFTLYLQEHHLEDLLKQY